MDNRYLILALIFLALILGGLVVYQNENIEDLHFQLAQRDELLSSSKFRDSAYAEKTKEYSEVINHYMTGCSFTSGGKEITVSELVRVFNKTLDDNSRLRDSLRYFKDRSSLEGQI